jgi:hypothetical protein
MSLSAVIPEAPAAESMERTALVSAEEIGKNNCMYGIYYGCPLFMCLFQKTHNDNFYARRRCGVGACFYCLNSSDGCAPFVWLTGCHREEYERKGKSNEFEGTRRTISVFSGGDGYVQSRRETMCCNANLERGEAGCECFVTPPTDSRGDGKWIDASTLEMPSGHVMKRLC